MNPTRMQSAVVKRSLVINGHKTSVSLEDAFWLRLKEIAAEADKTISKYVEDIDCDRTNSNLSSALRVHLFEHAVRETVRIKALYSHDDAPSASITIAAKTVPPANDYSGQA